MNFLKQIAFISLNAIFSLSLSLERVTYTLNERNVKVNYYAIIFKDYFIAYIAHK